MQWTRLWNRVRRPHEQRREPATEPADLAPLDLSRIVTPPVDIFESDRELIIRADVPGGSHVNATVSVDDQRRLTLLVRRSPLPEGTARIAELSEGDWYRAFELPPGFDGSDAESTLEHGVLTIRVPRRAPTTRRIPIRAA